MESLPWIPLSLMSRPQHLEYKYSRSSTFCGSLNSSSSTSSKTHGLLKNLPLQPQFPISGQLTSEVDCSTSPLLSNGDMEVAQNNSEHSDNLMNEFVNLSGEFSDDSIHNGNYTSSNLTPIEQMDLQILSEQLGIAITDHGESPSLDDIYETPQSSCFPLFQSTVKQADKLNTPAKFIKHLNYSTSGPLSAVKPRLHWTLELHERFLEAVNKLDGPEKATPKGILKLMNTEGLTIYNIKSHLQKYRLAKFLPDTKEDKKVVTAQDTRVESVSHNSDAGAKRNMQVSEALRIQIEVQKMLHEQLEVQRTLQLRVEEHARYLQKIIEEQQNGSNSSFSSNQIRTSKSQPECLAQSSPERVGSGANQIPSPPRDNEPVTEFRSCT